VQVVLPCQWTDLNPGGTLNRRLGLARTVLLAAGLSAIALLGTPGIAGAAIGGQALFTMDIISNVPYVGYWCPAAGNQMDTSNLGNGQFDFAASTWSRGAYLCGTLLDLQGQYIAVDDVIVFTKSASNFISFCASITSIEWNDTAGTTDFDATIWANTLFCLAEPQVKVVSKHYYIYGPTGQNDWDDADGGWFNR